MLTAIKIFFQKFCHPKAWEFKNINRSQAYSLNCNNQAAAGKWLQRMERAAERTSQKLRKNVGSCS